jgi:four helix bundle protein
MRSSMSIAANIVEGREQRSERQFLRYLRISIGSSSELEYHLLFAHDAGEISTADYESLVGQINEVRKMLFGLTDQLGREGS